MVPKRFDLLSLPDSILNDVLCCRLGTIKELARLETAMWQHQLVEEWLRIASSDLFIFQRPVNISKRSHLQWLRSTEVKASAIVFREDCDERLVSDYLRFSGASVRSVVFSGGDKAVEMLLVALYCKNITSVKIYHVQLRASFGDFLLNNPNIEEICMEWVTSKENRMIEGVSLPKLHTIHAVATDCLLLLVDGLRSKGVGITTLVMNNSPLIMEWGHLAGICSQLRSFCSYSISIRDDYLERFSLATPLLCNLSFAGCPLLVDASVQLIVQNMTSLCSLNIRECSSLTDMSLQHIADYAGNRMKVLYCDIKLPESAETEAILSSFSRKCTPLTTLNVHCGTKVLCAGSCLSALVSGCPKLRRLIVNMNSTIGASSRNLVAMLRPDLEILDHDGSTAYNVTFFCQLVSVV